MDQSQILQSITEKPLFEPVYLNIDYIFNEVYSSVLPVIDFVFNPKTWSTIGVISMLMSIFCIAVIIFSIVRIAELQSDDKREIDMKIKEALIKEKEKERLLNPRWKYILTLLESPNESDWRISIIEADNLLEEKFKENGLFGNTMSELLEEAKSGGYMYVQNAWDAHIVRNKIAHEGSNFPLSQIEARRVIKMYQSIFEEMKVI